MMSEEEKKAINVLKNMFFDEYEWAIKDSKTTCYTDPEEAKNSINSVLNLIEKQQKEIEELKIKNKKVQEINYRVNKNLLELAETSISKDKIREKIKELEEQGEKLKYDGNRSYADYEQFCKNLNFLKEQIKELLEEN